MNTSIGKQKDLQRGVHLFKKHRDQRYLVDIGNFFHCQYPLEECDDEGCDDYDLYYEEDEEENLTNSYFNISNAGKFTDVCMHNKLDDLGEILANSTKFEHIQKQVRKSRRLFKDPEFLPNQKSLVGYITDPNRIEKTKKLVFERSGKYFGPRTQVFNMLSSGDILQGHLGDCYFLAAIRSIAEFPERILRILLTKENDGTGIFAVALCLNGVWEEVILDDLAPCFRNGTLAFNRSKANELWVVLLEKAWAKVHRGYLNIEAGLTREALRDLTGASVKTFFLKGKQEKNWNHLLNAHKNNYIMTAGSDKLNNGSDVFIPKVGICGSHAYSLLAVYQLLNENGFYKLTEEGEEYTDRILKLRNPWGKGEWKGEWADNDARWTPQLKRLLGFTGNAEDGIFFISWKYFQKYFNDVQICYYHDNYKYSAKKFETTRNEILYLKFTMDTPGKYYFSANQRNRRFYPKHLNYKFSRIDWVIGQKIGENAKFVGSGNIPDKENWDVAECDKGEYYLMIETPWRSITREFSFSIYGPGLTELKQINKEDLPENFLANAFKSSAKELIKTKGFDFRKINHPGIKYISGEKNGWAFTYFQNDEYEHSLEAKLKFGNKNKGVKVLPPHQGFNPSIIVSPGENDIVIFKSTGSKEISLSMIASIKKARNVDIKKKLNTILKSKLDSKSIPRKTRPSTPIPRVTPWFKRFNKTRKLYYSTNDDLSKSFNSNISSDCKRVIRIYERNGDYQYLKKHSIENGGPRNSKIPYRLFESNIIHKKKYRTPSFNSDIRSRARNSKIILKKFLNRKVVPIRLHVLNHHDGWALLYINDSDNLILAENILFNLSNARIKGQEGNRVELILLPKKETMIEIIRNDRRRYEISIKKLSYIIS